MPQANPSQNRDLPVQLREATLVPSTFDEAANTVEVVWTQGAAVRRYDYWNERPYDEALEVSPEAVDMVRFEAGTVQVLDGHRTYGGVSAILGIAQRGWIESGEGRALLRLSERPELAGVVADIKAGVIRSISFGYSVQKYEITRAQDRTDGINVDLYRAVRWTPQEISFVTVPADPGAGTRSQPSAGGMPCEFVTRAAARNQEPSMPQTTQDGSSQGAADPHAASATAQQRQQPAVQPAATDAPVATVDAAFTGARAVEIVNLCQRHGVADLQADFLQRQVSLDEARAAVLAHLEQRSAGAGPTASVRTINDQHDTRMRGLQNALMHRVNPTNALDDNGRQYRGLSLVEMAREVASGLGVNVRGLSRPEIIDVALRQRSYQGTGDFPALLGGIGQRVLRGAYEQAPSTYQMWAHRAANLPDFRIRQVIGVGGDVELKKINEHGEYTYGQLSEDAAGYRAFSYGRSLALTRQMLVNDDLDAFTRVGVRFADAARRLENRLAYEQLTGNPRMHDGQVLFHASHKNDQSGAALSLEALSTGRALMRKQKDMDGTALNLAPAYLLVPSDLEAVAYQLTSANYVPAKATDVNEFRAGGRTALEPIVEPLLDAAAATYFLLARTGQVDTVEFAYVDGYEGLRVESFASEDVDGIKLRATLDFAAKATDWRGIVRGAA